VKILAVPYDHPDAVKLVAEVQQVYVERYGGVDETPLEPEQFEPPNGLFLIGYSGTDPVACGAWRAHDGPAPAFQPGDAEFKRMYVADSVRGRGLARMILSELERTAALSGRTRAVLETGTKQPEALALYRSSGYQEIPKFGIYKDSEDSRCFGKAL
jgi:GNAT superfamily N-acetyltransferase